MANIAPVTVWYQGEQHNANVFNLYLTDDNLIDSASLKYQLIESNVQENSNILITGLLSINGADYELWDAEIDANAWIYNWAASQLNLTII